MPIKSLKDPTAPVVVTKKRRKKPTNAEKFVEALEGALYSRQKSLTSLPEATSDDAEVATNEALGLSNVTIKQRVLEYLPVVEQLKISLNQGKSLKAAMEECNIPYNPDTRKAWERAVQLDFIITHRAPKEVEKMLVQAARTKFLTKALLEEDSKSALKWAQLIQEDNEVFETKEERTLPTLYVRGDDLAKFIESNTNEDVIEAEYREVIEAESPEEEEKE